MYCHGNVNGVLRCYGVLENKKKKFRKTRNFFLFRTVTKNNSNYNKIKYYLS